MIETSRESGELVVEHDLQLAMYLCLDCEHVTGRRAVRNVTRDGRCSTCTSASIVPAPREIWFWLRVSRPATANT